MLRYEVYATRWDSTGIVEELIPATGLSFSMPLSAHGEASFSATAEPGRSLWRDSISPPMSGIIVACNGTPVWAGQVLAEDQTGPRTFSFKCREWGAFYSGIEAIPATYRGMDDHAIWRDVITRASALPGAGAPMDLGASTGSARSDLTISPWDHRTVDEVLTSLGNTDGGPEWYYGIRGTLDAPVRQLYLGDRLGRSDIAAALEYVEQIEGAPETGPAFGYEVDRVNWATNPSVENDASGWSRWTGTGGVATAAQDPAAARFGGYGYRVTWTTAPATGGGALTPLLSMSGWARQVTISAYVRPTVTLNMYAESQYFANASTATTRATGSPVACPANQWTRLSVTGTSAATDAFAQLRFYVSGAGVTAATIVDFDGLLIEDGATLADYFDGDTPGATWSGTPGASTSTSTVITGARRVGARPVAIPIDYANHIPRSGGNVLTLRRTRDSAKSATVAVATGAGDEAAQITSTATATKLLAAGWPRMVNVTSYSSVSIQATLDRHARADLAASAGITTGYQVTTIDGDPDWTEVPRGSLVRLYIDTDAYGTTDGPQIITTRLLSTSVTLSGDGDPIVEWDLATVLDPT